MTPPLHSRHFFSDKTAFKAYDKALYVDPDVRIHSPLAPYFDLLAPGMDAVLYSHPDFDTLGEELRQGSTAALRHECAGLMNLPVYWLAVHLARTDVDLYTHSRVETAFLRHRLERDQLYFAMHAHKHCSIQSIPLKSRRMDDAYQRETSHTFQDEHYKHLGAWSDHFARPFRASPGHP